MITLDVTTLFTEDDLAQLPLTFRFMTPIETTSFEENYSAQRFGRSGPHFSKQYLSQGSYKPLSDLIYQDLFSNEP